MAFVQRFEQLELEMADDFVLANNFPTSASRIREGGDAAGGPSSATWGSAVRSGSLKNALGSERTTADASSPPISGLSAFRATPPMAPPTADHSASSSLSEQQQNRRPGSAVRQGSVEADCQEAMEGAVGYSSASLLAQPTEISPSPPLSMSTVVPTSTSGDRRASTSSKLSDGLRTASERLLDGLRGPPQRMSASSHQAPAAAAAAATASVAREEPACNENGDDDDGDWRPLPGSVAEDGAVSGVIVQRMGGFRCGLSRGVGGADAN